MELESAKISSRSNGVGVWDAGSSLYDSFELKSFEDRLKLAIASRTLSMPHLINYPRQNPPLIPSAPAPNTSKFIFFFFKPFQKLVRTLFRSTQSKKRVLQEKLHRDEFYLIGFQTFHQDKFELSDHSSSSNIASTHVSQDQTAPGLVMNRNMNISSERLVGRRRSMSERFASAPLHPMGIFHDHVLN